MAQIETVSVGQGGDAEVYTLEQKAEFLLSNAIDAADYAAACKVVRSLGLDPNDVAHHQPSGVGS